MSKNCPWWIHFTPILHFKLCFCSEIRNFADSALKPSAHGGAKLDFPRLGNRLWRRGVCLVLHILILGFGAALPPQQSLHSHLDPHVWSQTAWAFKVSILWEKTQIFSSLCQHFLEKICLLHCLNVTRNGFVQGFWVDRGPSCCCCLFSSLCSWFWAFFFH